MNKTNYKSYIIIIIIIITMFMTVHVKNCIHTCIYNKRACVGFQLADVLYPNYVNIFAVSFQYTYYALVQ